MQRRSKVTITSNHKSNFTYHLRCSFPWLTNINPYHSLSRFHNKPIFMKLFKSNNMETITYCQQQFSFDLPSVLWAKRVSAFNLKFDNTDNLFCRLSSRL